MMAEWQKAAAEKRQSLLNLIPDEWVVPVPPPPEVQRDITGEYVRQYLNKDEVDITESEVSNILRRIHEGQWKARDVTAAFCHRAALAHQLTNCLHEIFFEAALNDAQALDDHFAATGELKGPLHGLPISLKDQFHVKDVETTMGYVGWIGTFQGEKGTGNEKVFESELVRELRDLGAILYCKTSVPHTLMTGETINNIIGYVPNPKNRLLTAGGSSGGEGALLGLRGSCLGVGTDIGGSVRFPSAFNGLYGLRPSSGRLPYEGMANSMDGQNTVLSVLGPMAHSVDAVKLFTKSVLSRQPWLHDPAVVEIPWRESIFQSTLNRSKPMVFGILANDGYVAVQPPVERALRKVADTLKSLGHILVDWDPPSHKRAVDIASAAYGLDGGSDVFAALGLSNEPMAKQVAQTFGNERRAENTASQIAVLNVKKREYQKEYMEYWNSTSKLNDLQEPVTAVIAPISTFAAPQPEKFNYYGYATFVNVLDYSAVTIPVTHCDKDIDVFDERYVPMNSLDEETWKDYDAETYHGALVGLQLVGRRFEEEKIIALAAIIAGAL
ncbi:acetamidase [Sarocladium strictum]